MYPTNRNSNRMECFCETSRYCCWQVAFLSASQTNGWFWMNEYECVNVEPKVDVNSSLCAWKWNLMKEAHDPVLILPKLRLIWQKFFSFFFSLKQILEGGGKELVVSKKCLSWGTKTTSFHYTVPFHQNEAIHHCSCGTTNPALSTLTWEKRKHRVSKSLNVQKKRGRWSKQTETDNRVKRGLALRPLWSRMLQQRRNWCHVHKWKCCFVSETSKITTVSCFKQTEAETTDRNYECKLQVDSDQALNSGIMLCFQTIPGQMIYKTFRRIVDFFAIVINV